MATVPKVTNQGSSFQEEPYVFPSFGNVGSPYIATLNLPSFTTGLPIWLFSTPLVLNAPTSSQASSPMQEHQTLIDHFPSSHVASSSLYSSSHDENLDANNQEAKKKKKMKDKKKKNKQRGTQPTIFMRDDNVKNSMSRLNSKSFQLVPVDFNTLSRN
jgi:hypothetical protein